MSSRISKLHDAAHDLFVKGTACDRNDDEVMARTYYKYVSMLVDEGLTVASAKSALSAEETLQVESMKKWKGYLKRMSKGPDSLKSGADAIPFENQIEGEIMQARDDTTFKDIAGMKQVKIALTEMVILPSVRSDIYTGIRTPPRGLLLFGPPGNGKTYIARAVANEVNATFFSISATSFASSLVGHAEKLLRALFTVARRKQPSLIFIDEIDSILTKRCENDQEHTRKLKTEFLVQFDGVATDKSDNVTIIAATNLPQELDEAAVRRFEKKIYVGLPDFETRKQLLRRTLTKLPNKLTPEHVDKVCSDTMGYSASDLNALCKEAAMLPLRDLGAGILDVKREAIREVSKVDFDKAMAAIKPSVSKKSLKMAEQWNEDFGSFPNMQLN